MGKYVAFLRAINVGGRTIKMEHLRGAFEKLGFKNVETLIASGNVIFESPSGKGMEKKIEDHLEKILGYRSATFLRTIPELEAILNYTPFPDRAGTLYVGFMAGEPKKEISKKLESLGTQDDALRVYRREVYWLIRTKFSESNFSGATIEKTLGMSLTLRNINTIRRIVQKYPSKSL